MKATKDKRKKIQLNDKIKYYTRFQTKILNQQDLAKIKVEKQETNNIKTTVNRQLTVNFNIDEVNQQIFNTNKKLGKNYTKNSKTTDSCESLINVIPPSTNEQSKIPNDRKRKNWSDVSMERKKNKNSRKFNYQPFLEINNKCFNISLDDIYYKNNFKLTHSFNMIEFSDSFKSLSCPEVKVLDQTYDSYYNHTVSSCLDNYSFKPLDCIKKENDVHNLEQSTYININKNNSDNNHDLNIFKLLLQNYWCFYNFNLQTLFSKVNESKKSETYYSEMIETDKISSTREIYSKCTTTKEASLLKQLCSGISEYEKLWFLYDSFSFKTRKIYSLITKIAKVQSTQNSNSKITDMKRTSKIFTKLFKMETMPSPHEIYFEIIYMGKGLSLPKTYSVVTTKFRLSLPITYFKNTKKKVLKKIDLSLNELLYSKLAKTKQQDSPADKSYFKAENASFSCSNLIKCIDIPHSQLETFFDFTVTDRKYYLRTYSRKNLKKKLPLLKSYSRVIVHGKVFLLRKFSKKNIRDQQYILGMYNILSGVTIEEKCIKNASNINSKVVAIKKKESTLPKKNKTRQKVIRFANEDNTEQLNHNQSSSDITHLIGSDSCLCVDCYKAIKKRTSLKDFKKLACIVKTCEQTVSHGCGWKWMKTFKSLNTINFRVQTNEDEAMHKIPICNEHYEQILVLTECQLCGNRALQNFHLNESNESKVHQYQSVLDKDGIFPATIKYDTLICKLCHIYLLLRGGKTTKMSFELEKDCEDTKTRIINHYRLKMKELKSMELAKSKINVKKTDNKLLLVKSQSTKKRNIFTADSSMVLKPVLSAIEFANTTTTVITTTIETKPLMTTRTMTMTPMSMVLTSATENLSPLGFNQKIQPTFLDTHPSVPRTIKRPVTTNYRKHSMPVHKLTTPDHRITIPVEKPVSPMTLVNKSTILVDKPMIADHKKKLVFTQALRPITSSELSIPKEHVKSPNSVSSKKIPITVQTDQLLNNSLGSRSKSLPTESLKSSHNQVSKFSSTVPKIIQSFKTLKTNYPNTKLFVNSLIQLEARRNLGYFTVQNNETIHHQRMSSTATTPPH